MKHIVVNNKGKIVDEHFRLHFKPRKERLAGMNRTDSGLPIKRALSMFILDVMRHDDAENISSIVNMLNDDSGSIGWREFWLHDFTREEVLWAMNELIAQKFVQPLREGTARMERVDARTVNLQKKSDDLWFALTKAGRQAWQKWIPPKSIVRSTRPAIRNPSRRTHTRKAKVKV